MNRSWLKVWRDTPSRLSDIVDRGGVMLILILEKGETGKSSNLCSS